MRTVVMAIVLALLPAMVAAQMFQGVFVGVYDGTNPPVYSWVSLDPSVELVVGAPRPVLRAIQPDVSEIKERVGGLQAEVAALQSQLAAAQSQLAGQAIQQSELEARITALENATPGPPVPIAQIVPEFGIFTTQVADVLHIGVDTTAIATQSDLQDIAYVGGPSGSVEVAGTEIDVVTPIVPRKQAYNEWTGRNDFALGIVLLERDELPSDPANGLVASYGGRLQRYADGQWRRLAEE